MTTYVMAGGSSGNALGRAVLAKNGLRRRRTPGAVVRPAGGGRRAKRGNHHALEVQRNTG